MSGRAIVYSQFNVEECSTTAGRELARQLEAAHAESMLRYCASLARLYPARRAASIGACGGYAVYTGVSPFSSASAIALHRSLPRTELDEIEDFYRSRHAPVRIEICPYSDPSLMCLLRERHYRLAEITTVLHCEIDDAACYSESLPDGVNVRWAIPEDAERWAEFLTRCFYVSDPGPERRHDLVAMFLVPESLNCMGYVDGSLAGVGGGMLPVRMEVDSSDSTSAIETGIATFYGGCTLPGSRKRGLHAAILQHRLNRAARAGCRIALATAIPGSNAERNLQRHGFHIAYEKRTFIKSNK